MNNCLTFAGMKGIRNLLAVFLEGSILVGASVACLVLITQLNFDLQIDKNLLLFVFFGSIFGYNFIKYLHEFKATRGKVQEGPMQLILGISVISALLSGFYFIELSQLTKMLILVPLALTIFYTIPFFKTTLRTQSGFKIYIIALCWACVTVLLPIASAAYEYDASVWVTFIQRFVFVFALMIPFEIRDMDTDDISLKTIPQRFGIKKSKMIGALACVLFLLLEFFKAEVHQDVIVMITVFLLTLLLIVLTQNKQPKYYSSMLVESIPIIWFMLLYYYF